MGGVGGGAWREDVGFLRRRELRSAKVGSLDPSEVLSEQRLHRQTVRVHLTAFAFRAVPAALGIPAAPYSPTPPIPPGVSVHLRSLTLQTLFTILSKSGHNFFMRLR